MNKQKILNGVFLLTMAAFISKVLSAIYRIPLENFVGNLGFYVYQQVYPIYGIGMTLALNGLPIFISKLIAEKNNLLEQEILAQKLIKLLGIFSIVIFIVLNISAKLMAYLMGDVNLTPVIRAVSFMFLMLPVLAVGRGVSQGQLKMQKTGISQVLEQVIRVSIIIVVAYFAMIKQINVYLMGTLAMLSAPISSFFSSLIFLNDIKQYFKVSKNITWWDKKLIKQILNEGSLITGVVALLIILQLIDSFTIQNGLLYLGIDKIEAQTIKGIYDRSQPIVQFCLVLATSFGTSLVPVLRNAYVNNDLFSVITNGKILLRLTLWLSSAVVIGVISLMPLINKLLFGSDALSDVISVYVLSAIVMSILIMLTSILQSIDYLKPIKTGLLIAICTKLLLNIILIRYLSIMGASVSTVLALISMLLYVVNNLPSQLTKINIEKNVIVKMLLNLIVMYIIVVGISQIKTIDFNNRFLIVIPIIIGAVIGGIILVALTLLTKTLTKAEWSYLPLVNKLIKEE